MKFPSLAKHAITQDHFEILSIRRTNPHSHEPADWRFRLRVLSPTGLTVNYSTMLTAGDERDLQQSDTITVALEGHQAQLSVRTEVGHIGVRTRLGDLPLVSMELDSEQFAS